MVAQFQWNLAVDGQDTQGVVPRAPGDRDMACIGGKQDQITAGPGVDGRVAPAHDDGVAARATGDDVVTRSHVDIGIAAATHKAVVAGGQDVVGVIAKVGDAAHSASGKLIVACATDDAAARGAAQDQETVVARTAIDVEHGIHPFRDVERVVAGTTTGVNFLDTAACVAVFHPE